MVFINNKFMANKFLGTDKAGSISLAVKCTNVIVVREHRKHLRCETVFFYKPFQNVASASASCQKDSHRYNLILI